MNYISQHCSGQHKGQCPALGRGPVSRCRTETQANKTDSASTYAMANHTQYRMVLISMVQLKVSYHCRTTDEVQTQAWRQLNSRAT